MGISGKTSRSLLCDFDRASSLICGNKMPTRCNRWFYCRSYCLLNMFRAPLCPSSGARENYTSGCCKICNKNHLLHLVGILFPHITIIIWDKNRQWRYLFKIYLLRAVGMWQRVSIAVSKVLDSLTDSKAAGSSFLSKTFPTSNKSHGVMSQRWVTRIFLYFFNMLSGVIYI